MELKFGDIQETALIPLAIKASETSRPNARIIDLKAKEIIDTLGVDVSKYDPFMSHEGVVARTIMFRRELQRLLKKYPDALCVNLGCGFDDKFSQVDNGKITWFEGKRIDNPNTHGTGCTLSSAIASNLAKGFTLAESVRRAKEYISGALAAMLDLGKGAGPMMHNFDLKSRFAEEAN